MEYQVCIVDPPVVYDSLPVAKILNYPLEKRDYKPYAQAILCAAPQALYLRMWAFEVSPMPESLLRCALYPGVDTGSPGIQVDMTPQGSARLTRLGADGLPDGAPEAATASAHNGEDLQGVYWGGTIELALADLERLLGFRPSLAPGSRFRGNFYKLSTNPGFAHCGSFFPEDFSGAACAPQCAGSFVIVPY